MHPLTGHTVLVTGATGFVGSALTLRLAGEGVPVKALARSLHKTHPLRTSPHAARIEILHGDVTALDRMQRVIEGCTLVFHVAAALGTGNLALSRAVNVDGTRNIMRAAAGAGVTRVVHMSSAAVYGYRVPATLTEDDAGQPSRDSYAITKAQAESVVREFGAAHNLPYTILRPGGIFGPGSWWNRTFARLAQYPMIPIYGAGGGALPAIDLDDLIDLSLLTATHPGAINEAFTAVYDPAPTIRAALELFARAAGRTRLRWLSISPDLMRLVARIYAPFAPPFSRGRDRADQITNMTHYTRYSMDKARARLDWSPQIDLATSLERALRQMRTVQ